MIYADDLRDGWPVAMYGDRVHASRPKFSIPFIVRLQDALEVLLGRAEAVRFFDYQNEELGAYDPLAFGVPKRRKHHE